MESTATDYETAAKCALLQFYILRRHNIIAEQQALSIATT
jgi:hypothetical protein